MKRFIVIIIILFSLDVLEAAFENIDLSTEGMKTAFACNSKIMGVSSMYVNPAGLVRMKYNELNLQYLNMLAGIDNDSLNYFNFMVGLPFKYFQLAAGVNMFGSDLYSEQVYSIAGSKLLFKILNKDIALGIRMKLLRIVYNENDYTLLDRLFINNGYSKSRIGFDVGVMAYSKRDYSFGFAFKNINSPDMTLDSSGFTLPFKFQCGAGYRLRFTDNIYKLDVLFFDMDFKVKKSDYSFHFGVEAYFFNRVFSPGVGFAVGNKNMRYFTAGLSYLLSIEGYDYKFKIISYFFKVNYVFRFYLGGISSGTYGDHFISLSFMF